MERYDDIPGIFQKLLSGFVWFIVFLIFILTIITWIAKKSLPGDRFYGFKLNYQATIISVLGAFDNVAGLQISYTKERYDETNAVIDTERAKIGFDSLNDQISNTTSSILSLEDTGEQKTYADVYISTLYTIKSDLSKKKTSLQAAQTNQTIIENPVVPTVVVAPTTSPSTDTQTVVDQIETTETNIDQTIEVLKEIQDQSATQYLSPTPLPPIPTEAVGLPKFNRLESATPTPKIDEMASTPTPVEKNNSLDVIEPTPTSEPISTPVISP